MTLAPLHRRPAGCPSDLELDELSAGDLTGLPQEARLRGHLGECPTCGQRLAARQADPVLAPDPALLRPLVLSLTQSERSRTRRRRWLGGLAAVAVAGSGAAAALLLSAGGLGRRDEPSGERTKGTSVLTVHVKRAQEAGRRAIIDQVNGEGRLRPGDEMRFTIATTQPGQVVVLGVDAAPSVTIYVPAAGSPQRPTAVAPSHPVTLPGSVIADETPGDERVVALVCGSETAPEVLRGKVAAALKRADGHPERISSFGTGCLEASVLLHKDGRRDGQ